MIFAPGRLIRGLHPMNLSPVEFFRADHGITIATGVSSWRGHCGLYNAVQATGSLQPVLTASVSAINNKPTVDADGVDDILSTGNQNPVIAHPNHIIVVGRWKAAFASADGFIDGGSSNHARVYRDTAGRLNMFAGANRAFTGASETSFHMFEFVFNGASSSLWQDGVQLGTTADTGTNALNGVTFGNIGGGGQPGNVAIAEWFCAPRVLSSPELSYYKRYVNAWYGLSPS